MNKRILIIGADPFLMESLRLALDKQSLDFYSIGAPSSQKMLSGLHDLASATEITTSALNAFGGELSNSRKLLKDDFDATLPFPKSFQDPTEKKKKKQVHQLPE